MIGSPVKKIAGEADEGVKWWLHQMHRGIRYRKLTQEGRWEENESFDDMRQWDGAEGDIDGDTEATINKVGSWIRTQRASLAFHNPKVKVTPKQASGWEAVQIPLMGPDGTPMLDQMTGQVMTRPVLRYKVREQILNEIIGAPLFGLRKTISRVVKSGAIAYGALKIGYRPIFETPYQDDPADQMVKVTSEGIDWSGYVMNPVTGAPAFDEDGNLISKTSIPAWEEWFIDWVHYRHIIIDPDGGNDFYKHCWVAQEIVRPLEDVKKDPLLKNTKDLKGSGDLHEAEELQMEEGTPEWMEDPDIKDKSETVRLFEIWDMKNDRLIVLADGHGKFLRNDPFPRGVAYSPFAFYRPNEVIGAAEQFYPRPPVTDLAPINKEYNKARRQQLVAMKKSNRKIITKKGSLDQKNMDALTDDRDMAVVELKADGAYDIAGSVQAFAVPPVAESIYANIQFIARDFDEVAGQPGEARGVASSKTATQVNSLGQYASLRLDFDRMVLVDCLTEALKKLDDSIEANMTVERAVSIVGEDGAAWVGIVDPDMIAGDYDVSVDIEDMLPIDSAQQAALKAQFAQIAGQSPWLMADETLAIGWCKEFGIKDENFAKALSRAAQMQMAMAMAPAQPKVPNAPPPESGEQAMAQNGAGSQVPNMQGAA